MKIAGVVSAAALAALAVAGCGKDSKAVEADSAKAGAEKASVAVPPSKADPKEVLATVGDKKLTRGEVEADFALVVKARGVNIPAAQMEMARTQFTKQRVRMFLDVTMLRDEAVRKGLAFTAADRDAKVKEILAKFKGRPDAPKSLEDLLKDHPFGKERALAEFDEQMLVQKLIEQEVVSKIKVDAKKLEEEYKKAVDAAAKAAASSRDAEKNIQKIYDDLKGLKGDALLKKFAEVAKAQSACPSGQKGGDLGLFQRGQMVPEFDKVAFSSEPLVVSKPLKTQFGWHVLLVTKKVPAKAAAGDKPAEPEKVQASHILLKTEAARPAPTKKDVEDRIKAPEVQKAVMAYVEGVRKAAKITSPVYPELLPKDEKPAAPKAAPKAVESKPIAVKPAAAKPAAVAKPAEARKPAEAKK